MDIRGAANKVKEMKASATKPSLPINMNLLGGLIKVQKVGQEETSPEIYEAIKVEEPEENVQEEDSVLTAESILNMKITVPEEFMDSEGYMIPVRKVDSKTFVPCDLDEKGNPVEPLLTKEGNYVYYDMLDEYGFMTAKRLKKEVSSVIEQADALSHPAVQSIKGILGDVKVGITDKLRG